MTTITKGFKFRFYPNAIQKDLLARYFGCGRFVYNHLLNDAKEQYELDPGYGVSSYDFIKRIPALKEEFVWLKEISSVTLQQKAMDLGEAFGNFFRKLKKAKTPEAKAKAGFPKFKNKHSRQSFRLVGSALRFKDGEFFIPKCKDPLKIKWSRELPSEPTSCTISKTPSGEYYISFVVECDPVLTNGTKETGVDLGLTDLVILSDGTRIPNPKYYVNAQRKLARLQRQHARKQKGSRNKEKLRIKIAKLHQYIANLRKDYLHKLTRMLVNENQVIGIESLNVEGMKKNRKLSKAIGDVGWRMLSNFLSYKVRESGCCKLVRLNPFYPSSHLCSVTDKRLDRKLELKERKWDCPHCNQTHDRDINAAMNILKRAKACIEDNPVPELILNDSYIPA